MAIAQQHKSETGKYVGAYVCLLALAGLQFIIAYQNIDAQQMVTRMLIVALIEGVLAVLVFMHLWAEKRGFLWFVAVFTIFVLLTMQYGWTDSFRMRMGGAPFSSYSK
ncbi:MAG TPA: cytochrome C oxidase subunit IV family protein [Terriglobales bacterium]|jgi:heme/copper-type cytochrome/quinol oxidase subunit 4|nr:cytochrome C oxidase subunit IV family protein [Terriglobales bacterium]